MKYKPFGAKQLLKDNLKMKGQIDNLVAVNSELVLMMEQARLERDRINTKIEAFNNKLDETEEYW